jgi:hypothetical protein
LVIKVFLASQQIQEQLEFLELVVFKAPKVSRVYADKDFKVSKEHRE